MTYYIIIRGPLGCGKSTIAKELSKILEAKCFLIDEVVDKHKLFKDKEEGYISQNTFIKANEIIVPEAKKILNKGTPVIFDGNFYWKSQIEDLVKRLKYPHRIFTLKAPLKVCIDRDKKREKALGKDAARVVYKKTTEFDYGTIIDITTPLNECVKEIIYHLPKK